MDDIDNHQSLLQQKRIGKELVELEKNTDTISRKI